MIMIISSFYKWSWDEVEVVEFLDLWTEPEARWDGRVISHEEAGAKLLPGAAWPDPGKVVY